MMNDTLVGIKRTDYCGTLRETDIGREVTVCGWVQRQRDLGGLIFVDLRDRTGLVQLAFDDNTDRAVFEKAGELRSEFVAAARGVVRRRAAVNKDIPTGLIEVEVTELRILSHAQTPPFEISDDCNAREELRLKYRYLDLRRPQLQQNLISIPRAFWRLRPRCSSNPPRRGPGTTWFPAGCITGNSTPCPNPLRSISSF